MLSLLIPIALSAVFVFIASSIIHMATPWHKNDLKRFPNEDELQAALRALNLRPGNYGLPKPDSMKEMQSPAFLAKAKAGPVGFITIKESWNFSMGATLAQWFAFSLVVSLFAGYIAGVAFGPGTEYLRIMQVAGSVAFAGYALGQVHESIWWGRNWGWTVRNVLDGLLYGLLTGGTFGWLWPR
ncbi:MAG TPA: hypothetical protein VEA16_21835 [Vicinamibacterales bacterium]|nr:hypothetical protein [Vicinamibacterales bacterium]